MTPIAKTTIATPAMAAIAMPAVLPGDIALFTSKEYAIVLSPFFTCKTYLPGSEVDKDAKTDPSGCLASVATGVFGVGATACGHGYEPLGRRGMKYWNG